MLHNEKNKILHPFQENHEKNFSKKAKKMKNKQRTEERWKLFEQVYSWGKRINESEPSQRGRLEVIVYSVGEKKTHFRHVDFMFK